MNRFLLKSQVVTNMSAGDQELRETYIPEGNEKNLQPHNTLSERSKAEGNAKILRPHNVLRNIYDLQTLLVRFDLSHKLFLITDL